MESIKVSTSKETFMRGSNPFFYLADTVWTAFTNIPMNEWADYLDYRQAQGFNTLQINILPQWDRSHTACELDAFVRGGSGRTDYTRYNPAYFEHAEVMLEMAAARGFVPALALLWFNYVQGEESERTGAIMPRAAIRPYVQHVAGIFNRFRPIYLVSGDTWFGQDAEDAYWDALTAVKEFAPEALAGLHPGTGFMLPERFARSDLVDFYMYQSGHYIQRQHLSHEMAQVYWERHPKKPIINGETVYEGHAHGVDDISQGLHAYHTYGRYSAFDVRKCVWQSLLSGAKAGFAYGASGVWDWNHAGNSTGPGADFGGPPFECFHSQRFPGAWDAVYARTLFEAYGLAALNPVNALLRPKTSEIRMAASADRVAIYIPYAYDIAVERYDLSQYEGELINLADHTVHRPTVRREGSDSVLAMASFNSDALYIGIRK